MPSYPSPLKSTLFRVIPATGFWRFCQSYQQRSPITLTFRVCLKRSPWLAAFTAGPPNDDDDGGVANQNADVVDSSSYCHR